MDADRKQIYQTGGKEDMPDIMQESDENKIRIAKELLLESIIPHSKDVEWLLVKCASISTATTYVI